MTLVKKTKPINILFYCLSLSIMAKRKIMEQINTLLEKYNNFKYEQLRSFEKLSETSWIATLVVQDDDGEDVESIRLEFINIKESRILVNDVLAFLDMSSGVSVIREHDRYAFAIGSWDSVLDVNNAPLYIISEDIKILDQ